MGIQRMADRTKFSRLRQSLVQFADEIPHLVRSLLSDTPVIRGSVYELKRRCGKPGCKCAQGQLHARMVLSASEGGRTKLRVIPKGSHVEVQIRVRRYQELRRIRARLGEIHKKILGLIDQMEAMRREDMTLARGSAARARLDSIQVKKREKRERGK